MDCYPSLIHCFVEVALEFWDNMEFIEPSNNCCLFIEDLYQEFHVEGLIEYQNDQ
jgi:hypothetical protein